MRNRRKKRPNTRSGTPSKPTANATSQPQTISGSTPFHWRDHPIVIAALAAAGTFTITSYAFKEIIIPTQIAGLPALKAELAELKTSNTNQAEEISSLRTKLEAMQYQKLFNPGDPYPATLGSVKIGQPVTDIIAAYPGAKIEREDGYWSVDFGYGAIRRAVYYLNEKKGTVSHVMFALSWESKLSESFLFDRLQECLGKPSSHPKKTFFLWKKKNFRVYMSDSDRFLIHDSDSAPGYWPES